jgi:hypothetical protein
MPATMLGLSSTVLLLSWTALAAANDTVTAGRIKVQLFAAPSFLSEVSVDAYNNVCLSLDNNLIDGRVQSILVGGHDVATVLQRDDYWNCRFYEYVLIPSLSYPYPPYKDLGLERTTGMWM